MMVIPCHRAGCQDGEATRYYSPGAGEIRHALLEREQEVVHHQSD